MATPIPSELDWVNERSACTLNRIFETLKAQVSDDVSIRQGMLMFSTTCSLNFNAQAQQFVVLLCGPKHRDADTVYRAIAFILDQPNDRIVVVDESNNILLEATAALGHDGKCRLRIDGDELELWQVRRRALEDLFFNPYTS